MNKNPILNIFISENEIETLKNNTFISAQLLNKMVIAMQLAKQKRTAIRRIKISFSLKELDRIISVIADKANHKNSPDNVQCTLDSMFGRFANKYNKTVSAIRKIC
jgi:hypothetical protein